MTTAQKIEKQLKALGNKTDAEHTQRFFKTGPGQYGEGDVFLGIRVPVLRKLAKERIDTPLDDLVELLQSPFHEVRLTALLIMVLQCKMGRDGCPSRPRRSGTDRPTLRGERIDTTAIYRAYLANTDRINNWDLVDVTAEHIVGKHLFEKSRKPLYKLAKSSSLWERRIAIISTFYFIRRNDFDDTLALADILLHDEHDLMHKAVGWMLREVGKRDQKLEEKFLLPRYKQMPRTMLRYAIERFDEPLRQKYLRGLI